MFLGFRARNQDLVRARHQAVEGIKHYQRAGVVKAEPPARGTR